MEDNKVYDVLRQEKKIKELEQRKKEVKLMEDIADEVELKKKEHKQAILEKLERDTSNCKRLIDGERYVKQNEFILNKLEKEKNEYDNR